MTIHPNVRAHGLSTNLLLALFIADQVYRELGYEMVVRHLKDGKHKRASLHYIGNAGDLRTWDVDAEEIVIQLRKRLGSEYDVVLEDKGGPNEHIHLEYQPKVHYG